MYYFDISGKNTRDLFPIVTSFTSFSLGSSYRNYCKVVSSEFSPERLSVRCFSRPCHHLCRTYPSTASFFWRYLSSSPPVIQWHLRLLITTSSVPDIRPQSHRSSQPYLSSNMANIHQMSCVITPLPFSQQCFLHCLHPYFHTSRLYHVPFLYLYQPGVSLAQ